MKKFLFISLLINLGFNAASYFFLPETVASHFRFGGEPNAYMPRGQYIMVFVLLDVFMAAMFYCMPLLMMKIPASFVNLPYKNYWLTPEHKGEAFNRLKPFVYECGSIILLFLLLGSALGFIANQKSFVVLNEMNIFVGLAIFIMYLIFWTIRLIKGFQVSSNEER